MTDQKSHYNVQRINIEYRGHTYTRLADLAHAANIPTNKVNRRWHDGIRRLDQLLYDGNLPTTNNGLFRLTTMTGPTIPLKNLPELINCPTNGY